MRAIEIARAILTLRSGGAVLTQFLATRHPGISISALVRSEKQEELLRDLGVTPIRFQGLDDVVVIRAQAALHDGRLNANNGSLVWTNSMSSCRQLHLDDGQSFMHSSC